MKSVLCKSINLSEIVHNPQILHGINVNLLERAQRAKQREEQKLVAENPELAKEMQLTKDTKHYNTLKLDFEGEEDDKYLAMNKGKWYYLQ